MQKHSSEKLNTKGLREISSDAVSANIIRQNLLK